MEQFDVVVSGAGAAGLAAGLTLARALRSVVVFDGGPTRNAQADHSHGILGLDGASPAVLTGTARAEVERFGGTIRPGRAANAVADSAGLFVVTTDDGQEVRSRQILVASGVRDEMSEVPGVRELWGDRVVICPYCDGWEARGSSIAILGTGPKSISQAHLLRQWSDHVTLFTNDSVTPTAEDAARLERRGIRVVDGAVTEIRRADVGDRVGAGVELSVGVEQSAGVEFLVGGRVWAHHIVFTSPRPIPDNRILDSLHADMMHTAAGIFPRVDSIGATSISGVWVAGNAANPSLKYSTALGAGMDTATHINEALVEADVATAMSRTS
ncbi:NAD(P)/FAD-dependent oxidoreductase [Subtercola lobariae]|uniref:Oxidoreductase n=1 Tax=Subtercola lobariae TaxID=1588641 RepID=A0A917BB46_9MICO|nr:NAD(P)/FAD-dependent oxidoreductase [Subtercola lobariae]GGF32947.1 oxidoreductase [Subtercola lobariae]